MSTVNGQVTVDRGLRIEVPALKRGLNFALMPNSPSIISLGRRCMLEGYSFYWPAGTSPYMIDPNGQRIDLEVDNYVPFISSVNKPTVANPDVSHGLPPPPALANEGVDMPPDDPGTGSSTDHADGSKVVIDGPPMPTPEEEYESNNSSEEAVSYTHLTLPTKRIV